MKVNYVLMYGTPYLKYREFETFEDISKFLVNKRIVNYSIFKKLEDKEEVEMIYRDNDIRYLEEENERLKIRNKEIYNGFIATQEELSDYATRNEKAIRYIERCRDYHRDIHKEERIFPDEITSLLMILNGGDEE